jgi:hypothetical protein
MQPSAEQRLTTLVHTAEPGPKSEDELNLLASWAARSTRRRQPTRPIELDPRRRHAASPPRHHRPSLRFDEILILLSSGLVVRGSRDARIRSR